VGIRLLVVDSCLGDEETDWARTSDTIDKAARIMKDRLSIGLLVEHK
jgi:hypothetical protein